MNQNTRNDERVRKHANMRMRTKDIHGGMIGDAGSVAKWRLDGATVGARSGTCNRVTFLSRLRRREQGQSFARGRDPRERRQRSGTRSPNDLRGFHVFFPLCKPTLMANHTSCITISPPLCSYVGLHSYTCLAQTPRCVPNKRLVGNGYGTAKKTSRS